MAAELRQRHPYRPAARVNDAETVLQSPLLAAGVAAGVLLLSVVLRIFEPTVFPGWAPDDPAEALGLMWQVQTSIAAIAFAGLALIIQLAGSPPVAVRSSREVLYQRTLFRGLLLYAGATNVALGVVAIWIGGSAGVLLCFIFSFVLTVVFIGFSYFRVVTYFLDSERARAAALAVLRDKIAEGLHSLRLTSKANAQLGELFPPGSLISLHGRTPEGALETPLVVPSDDHYLDDLNHSGLKWAGVNILRRLPVPGFEASMPRSEPPVPQDAALAAVDPFLRIEVQLGQRVAAGEPLFTLVTATPVGPAQTHTFTAMLKDCVNLRPAGGRRSSDTESAIADELTTLKDSVLAAAGSGATGALEKGLDVYEELFSALLTAAGNRDMDPGLRYRAYGPHWQWLQINIREITDVAVRSLGVRGLTIAADHTYALCRTALKASDLSALREFLLLYPTHLRCAISARDPLPIDYVAISMQNMTSLYFRAVGSDDTGRRDALRELAAETFAESLKACIDAGEPEAFRKLLPYFELRQTFYTTNAEERSGADLKASVLLALLAWTFYTLKHLRPAVDLGPVAVTLADAVPSHHIWQAYLSAVGFDRVVPWRNWETAVKEPLTFHLMSFDRYLAAAALIMAGRKGITLPNAPAIDDQDRANMLLGAGTLAEECLRDFPDIAPTDLAEARRRLSSLVETAAAAQRDELRRRPLEREKIQEFVEAVPRSLRENPYRLTNLLPHTTALPTHGEPRTFSISALIAREFFVTSPRRQSEPTGLANDVANGMIVAENRFVVDSLLAGRQPKTAEPEHVREVLDSFAGRTGHQPFVLILNSWQTALALGMSDMTSEPPSYPGLSLSADDFSPDPLPPTCIVCDPALLPRLVRDPCRLDDGEAWHDLQEAGIAVAVRDYAEETPEPAAHVMAGVSLGWTAEAPSGAIQVFRLVDRPA